MKKVVKILRGIGYLAAFSLILYPVVSNYINQMNSTTIATDYEQEVSHLSEEQENAMIKQAQEYNCLLYTSPSPRDGLLSRMPSSA